MKSHLRYLGKVNKVVARIRVILRKKTENRKTDRTVKVFIILRAGFTLIATARAGHGSLICESYP